MTPLMDSGKDVTGSTNRAHHGAARQAPTVMNDAFRMNPPGLLVTT